MTEGFTYDRLIGILNYIVDNALLLGGFGASAAMVFYGFQMTISRGEPANFNSAKSNLIKAAIGALLIFGAYTIINTVQGAADSLK